MFICVQPFFACIGRRSHRLLAAARSHLPCKAKEAFLRSRELMTNLKPRPSGEVSATADGEGCRDFRPLAVRIECRREQATRPTEEVNSTCHNEISLFKIHRLLLPENTLGQPRTKVPTVRKRAFVFSRIKKRCGARRAPQTVRWTVCSQSGEQFIIATRNCSRRRSIRTAEDESPYNPLRRLTLPPLPKGEALKFRREQAPALRDKVIVFSIYSKKRRCGVRDTAASVPATFLLLFSSPEKRRYPFKASHSGRGGTIYRDGEGLRSVLCGRTQFAPTVRPLPRTNP